MAILVGILKAVYLISCAVLVIIVLLQAGKGGGLAAAFGGGGGIDSAFGAKVATPLRKVTAVFAGLFLVLAIVLAIIQSTTSAPSLDAINESAPAQEEPAGEGEGTGGAGPATDDGAMLPVVSPEPAGLDLLRKVC